MLPADRCESYNVILKIREPAVTWFMDGDGIKTFETRFYSESL